ncbi:MAG TPA: acetyl-CoA carboxylase biotin carboxylase subunit [Bryobacterales bacterium]|nr:acetyl-CoA carboxylase biotin carboxylase subunit [Bryobacterales bacterium]
MAKTPFRKILIANRGEVAVRVIRACREMGIASVAVYSEADRAALHVRMADEARAIGPAPAPESYLSVERIIEAARASGAGAIHPGYGFLSENPALARACDEAGIVFIGPSAGSMELMGSKTAARQRMLAAGVPVVPGATAAAADWRQAQAEARRFGYPILVKAAAGGGGKGMRVVEREEELPAAMREAASEAERAFGDPSVYIEKYLSRPRHIEIQVLGDRYGELIHLGERECSLQRRHQKVIEECPSPLVAEHEEMRRKMGETAVRAARAAGYYNAGTIEFLVDEDLNFYFLEMNTRLQVEHPVTEMVTGIDLVREQILIAAGEPLGRRQEQIGWSGAAIECRVYAEDPSNNFFPSPGRIASMSEPAGPGVRVDSGAYPGWTVPIEYDPLFAKLAVWAPSREGAIARLRRALDEYHVSGIQTNLGFFREIVNDPEFQAGRLDTGFIARWMSRAKTPPLESCDQERAVALAAALYALRRENSAASASEAAPSRWKTQGRARLLQ